MNNVILDTSPLHANASWVCSLEVVCTLEVLSLQVGLLISSKVKVINSKIHFTACSSKKPFY